jgi:aryl-alcohol dehydrogenase-like predicted oxidoreductase
MTKSANPLQAVEFGLGTWQWGDRFFWGFGQGYAGADLRAAFDASLAAGITFFDTAEAYGQGRSEKYLGDFLRASGARAPVATKFMPVPWRLGKAALRRALRASLDRLGIAAVDLYQMHWPFPPLPIETWMDAMADAVEAGLIQAVGVSNYNVDQTRRAYAALKRRGVRLASNQVSYSLLNRSIERDGLLALCQELDVRVIAYSPLAQGVLTGKYTSQKPPPGIRSARYGAVLHAVGPLIKILKEIGAAHGDKTPAQVALNWCMGKSTLPIPGATPAPQRGAQRRGAGENARQAQQNAGALGWRLSVEEMDRLDQASDPVRK